MKDKALVSICAGLLMASSAFAHHNFAAHYQLEETITVSGVVTEFRFVNPHVRVYVDVVNENGEVEVWMAEGDASVALRRSGWTADQLKPGDLVEIVGSPSRRGTNMLGWESITLADGSHIGGGDGRLAERLGILNEALTRFREQRGPLTGGRASMGAENDVEQIRVITSGGFTAAFNILGPLFEQATGIDVFTEYGSSMGGGPESIPVRLARGETMDVLIFNREAFDDLAAAGYLLPDTDVDLARSQVGMSVQQRRAETGYRHHGGFCRDRTGG